MYSFKRNSWNAFIYIPFSMLITPIMLIIFALNLKLFYYFEMLLLNLLPCSGKLWERCKTDRKLL